MAPSAELALKIECELKLELTSAEYERLRQAWGEAVERREQRNLYYEDVHDHSLWARNGFSLRLREDAGSWVLGIKGSGPEAEGWTQRPEWETAVEGASFAELLLGGTPMRRLAEELVGRLPEILADSDLTLRGELRNSRSLHGLPRSRAVVELDHFRLPDGNEGFELEFECGEANLRERGESELREIFADLDIAWRPSATSKRQRFEAALRSLE